MAETLFEQFLVEDCTASVRRLLQNAIDEPSLLQPFFEFNRFEVTIDRDNKIVVLEDVLDVTEAGVQRVPFDEFVKAIDDRSTSQG